MEYFIIMGCCVVQNIQEICFSFIEWNSGFLLVCYVALFSWYACLSVAPGLCMNTPSWLVLADKLALPPFYPFKVTSGF